LATALRAAFPRSGAKSVSLSLAQRRPEAANPSLKRKPGNFAAVKGRSFKDLSYYFFQCFTPIYNLNSIKKTTLNGPFLRVRGKAGMGEQTTEI
jgi:hypothetical protein